MKLDFEMVAGTYEEIDLSYKVDGAAVDITGATFACKVRSRSDLIDMSSYFEITDAAAGECVLKIPSAATTAFSANGLKASWDAQIILGGELFVLWEISKFKLIKRLSYDG